ncbi:lysine-rich arabinogalactan protein 19-like [Panicum hallii]|uniref:lysine-rich arabinogalactan protein 19-like n=1 Tax=Panicum hallii TaxID=206008 RepID=UPI000DF4EFA3|nr:lysine-rich arabinogalactan protein 19-like [Panicum hallii]
MRHASRASRVHTRACGRPLLASMRSPAPAQAEPPHTALAHALHPSVGALLLGPPEPPLQCLLAAARVPGLPPESASGLAHSRRFCLLVPPLGATCHESPRQPSYSSPAPLCAPARLAPAKPPPRAQQLPPAPAPVRCALTPTRPHRRLGLARHPR